MSPFIIELNIFPFSITAKLNRIAIYQNLRFSFIQPSGKP